MYYHASPVRGIQYFEPHISNHEIPLVYFSTKRENVLVYLSNAFEKYCRQIGYVHQGPWRKWGSYGFTADGILRLEEYYPNATADTYQGVSGYIYATELLSDKKVLKEIPFAVTSEHCVKVQHCEYIPDAYEAIMEAVKAGKIVLERYEEMSQEKLDWIKNSVVQEYRNHAADQAYRLFLKGKFPFLEG